MICLIMGGYFSAGLVLLIDDTFDDGCLFFCWIRVVD